MKTLLQLIEQLGTQLRSEADKLRSDAAFVKEVLGDFREMLLPTETEVKLRDYWLAHEAGMYDGSKFCDGQWYAIGQSELVNPMQVAGYQAGVARAIELEAAQLENYNLYN